VGTRKGGHANAKSQREESGKAFTSAPVSAGLAAFSEGFWVDERGHYSSAESVEWVAPERILVIFRERGGRPRISSNVLMIDRSPTEVG